MSEQVGDQGDSGKVLDGFHLHVGVLQVFPVSDNAVVSHQDRVILRNKRFQRDRKSTRLNSSHVKISYAVFCLKKKKMKKTVHGTAHDKILMMHIHLLISL